MVALAREFTLDDAVRARLLLENGAVAANIMGALEVKGAAAVLEGRKGDAESELASNLDTRIQRRVVSLCEVAKEGEGTTNCLERGETVTQIIQNGVVLDLETTVDDLEIGHGNVRQLTVADEGESASNEGEVGSAQRLERVLIETQGAGDVGQRRDRDGLAVTEGQVLRAPEIRQGRLEAVAVAGNSHGLGDARDLHADVLQQRVVDDGDAGDLLQVDAVERVQEGVLNVDIARLADAGGEAELLQVG